MFEGQENSPVQPHMVFLVRAWASVAVTTAAVSQGCKGLKTEIDLLSDNTMSCLHFAEFCFYCFSLVLNIERFLFFRQRSEFSGDFQVNQVLHHIFIR